MGLAERAGPQGGARAREAVEAVRARAPVLTGAAGALVDVLVTGGSGPARSAGADVARGGGGGLGLKVRNVKAVSGGAEQTRVCIICHVQD